MSMTDEQILSFIKERESRAKRDEVSAEQAMAIDYYLRRPFGNEEEGRSQVISSDVWDVVEGLTPIVIEPFVSSPDIVAFDAVGPEDEEAAKQESDFVNYVVTQRNDSFIQFLAWVKCGLLLKNGVVKWWWDETHRTTLETYRGISDDVLAAFMQDPEVEIVAKTENPPEAPAPTIGDQDQDNQPPQGMPPPGMQPGMPPQGQPGMGAAPQPGMLPPQGAPQIAMPPPEPTFDVTIRIRKKDGFARYAVVAPEELLVIGRDPNIQNASFVQHRTRVRITDLREMGYDVPDDISDGGDNDVTNSDVYTARMRDRDLMRDFSDDGSGDKSLREVWLRETYCYLDADGDGVAELRKVCSVGSKLLASDETEEIPFAGWTPYQQLFQFDGRCPADEAIEFQDVKTTLWRQSLDNLYTINNNRVFAGKDVNLDDLLDNQIAGVVRVTTGGDVRSQVASFPPQPLGQIIQPMIEYTDSAKENRTGFTRYNQGTDAESLNKTATGVRLISQAGNKRTGLVIRSFAEQGVKPLMLGMHGLIRRHATKAQTVRLRGKWVDIDPRSWQMRADMTVSVGLGTMDKQMELATQQEILKMQAGLAPAGFVTPENQYNAAAKFVELTGEKNADKYFTHPDKMPPKQPPDPMQNPEIMLKMAAHKLSEAQFQREASQKDRELDLQARALDQVDQKQGIEATNAQLDALARQHELQLKTEMHMRDLQAPHPQQLAAQGQAMQADQQAHQQGMDQANLAQSQQQIEQQAQPEATDGQA